MRKQLNPNRKLLAANIWIDDAKKGRLEDRLWIYDGIFYVNSEAFHRFVPFLPTQGARAHTLSQIHMTISYFRPFVISTDELSYKSHKEYHNL